MAEKHNARESQRKESGETVIVTIKQKLPGFSRKRHETDVAMIRAIENVPCNDRGTRVAVNKMWKRSKIRYRNVWMVR